MSETVVAEEQAAGPRFGRRGAAAAAAAAAAAEGPAAPRASAGAGAAWSTGDDRSAPRAPVGEETAVSSGPGAGGKHSWGGAGEGEADAGSSVAVIREADDDAERAEALAATVADAPRNTAGRRVATLSELDGAAAHGGASGLNVSASRASGIDLALLTASLYPPSALEESAAPADWALALQRITQEMTAESEQRSDAAAADGVAPPPAPDAAAGAATSTSVAGRTRGGGDTLAAGATRAA